MLMCIEKKVNWGKEIKEELYSPFVVDSLNRSCRVQWCLALELILSITQTDPGPDWAAQ